MEASPRSDSVWFVIAILAAAVGGIAAIAAIAAPVDAEPALRVLAPAPTVAAPGTAAQAETAPSLAR